MHLKLYSDETFMHKGVYRFFLLGRYNKRKPATKKSGWLNMKTLLNNSDTKISSPRPGKKPDNDEKKSNKPVRKPTTPT